MEGRERSDSDIGEKPKMGDKIYVESKYIVNGSYGPEIDKFLGKSPIDGPAGYKFMKLRYKTLPNSAGSLVATYRRGPLHRGVISMLNTGTRTSKNINEDQQGGSGISTEIKLVDGDIILAAILSCNDGRNYNARSGTYAAGITPVANATVLTSNTHYGVFSTDNLSPIVATAIGGGTVLACAGARKIACCHSNFVINNAHHVHTITAGDIVAEPALAIGVGPFATNTDAVQMEVDLTVYALVGPRVNGFTTMNTVDPNFHLDDLKMVYTDFVHYIL